MSRIGKLAISIPDGVSVERIGEEIRVKGPKGTLSVRIPERITLEVDGNEARLSRADDEVESKSLHGLARALTANMVIGVTEGFSKELEIQGVGYRAEVKGKILNLSLGFSHPVNLLVPEGLHVKVEENTKVRIEGAEKQAVGQFAADIRSLRPPEPYKGKGIRYKGEHVRRKVGKTGAVA